MDGNNRDVVLLRQLRNRDTRRQRDVLQEDRLVELHGAHVDFQRLRKVLRQAGDLDVGLQVRNDTALHLHARARRRVEEVDGQVDADRLILDHALQIHMHHLQFGRMHLHILDDDLLRLAVDVDRDDARIELLVVDHRLQLALVEREVGGFALAAIEDSRHLAGMTQAAARTFALVIARLGADFN